MSIPSGGDSNKSIEAQTAEAFGAPVLASEMGGETASKVPSSGLPENAADDSKNEKDQTASTTTAEENGEVVVPDAESHKLVIDTIEAQFELLDKGALSEEVLRSWFIDHPNIAEVANRSKRMKERYRSFMDQSTSSTGSQPKLEAKQEVSKDPSKEKPLTLNDLELFEKEREARILERTLSRERDLKAEKYAIDRKITDQGFDSLKRTAEALFRSNPDWTYDEALDASNRALFGGKNPPVGAIQGGISSSNNNSGSGGNGKAFTMENANVQIVDDDAWFNK